MGPATREIARTGYEFHVTIDAGEWLQDVMEKVAAIDGLAPEKQTLCQCQADNMELVPLPDSKPLGESIQEGSTLFVRRKNHAAWGEYATAWEQRDPAFLRPLPELMA